MKIIRDNPIKTVSLIVILGSLISVRWRDAVLEVLPYVGGGYLVGFLIGALVMFLRYNVIKFYIMNDFMFWWFYGKHFSNFQFGWIGVEMWRRHDH